MQELSMDVSTSYTLGGGARSFLLFSRDEEELDSLSFKTCINACVYITRFAAPRASRHFKAENVIFSDCNN